MKILLIIPLLAIAIPVIAQTDSVVAGVFSWNKAGIEKSNGTQRKNILEGSSKDLSHLEVHALTLAPGQSALGREINNDLEKLIIVKEGELSLTIKDSSKLLAPGSFAVVIAGDKHAFKNTSAKPVTYFSLTYTARVPVNIKRGKEAGGSFMKHWNELVVRPTDKGESRANFDRPTSMFSRFDMHATALNPGISSHEAHQHRAEEIILMIKGTVQVQIGQTFIEAAPGDVIFYPSYSLHAVKNSGSLQCGYFAIQWRNE